MTNPHASDTDFSLSDDEASSLFRQLERRAKRRRVRQSLGRFAVTSAALLVSAFVIATLLVPSLRRSGSPTSATESPTPSVIILDSPNDSKEFVLAMTDASPELSASEAIARYENHNSDFALPSDAVSYLGYYSAAKGDGTYSYKDRLAWGFAWHECIAPQPNPRYTGPPISTSCSAWLFLDANSGRMLEETWQH